LLLEVNSTLHLNRNKSPASVLADYPSGTSAPHFETDFNLLARRMHGDGNPNRTRRTRDIETTSLSRPSQHLGALIFDRSVQRPEELALLFGWSSAANIYEYLDLPGAPELRVALPIVASRGASPHPTKRREHRIFN
jgi:hypothetical protein